MPNISTHPDCVPLVSYRFGKGATSIDKYIELEGYEAARKCLALGPDGLGPAPDHIAHIMGQSMEALIHHFKLVTEGFRVPAGQAYAAIESARGELGCHVVSDGGTRPFRVHLRDPSFNHLQALPAMTEGGLLADVIPAIASIDPVLGGVDR